MYISKKTILILTSVIALIFSGVGVYAATTKPNFNGQTLYVCAKGDGQIRLTDSSTSCDPNEQAIPWNVAGTQGVPGPTGPTGPQGPEGPKGPKGDTGPQGNAGINGINGAPGAQGPQGPQGPMGLQGVAGSVDPVLLQRIADLEHTVCVLDPDCNFLSLKTVFDFDLMSSNPAPFNPPPVSPPLYIYQVQVKIVNEHNQVIPPTSGDIANIEFKVNNQSLSKVPVADQLGEFSVFITHSISLPEGNIVINFVTDVPQYLPGTLNVTVKNIPNISDTTFQN